jgi:hypothetical protein
VSESERETHTERVRERGPQWLKCEPIFGQNSPICSEFHPESDVICRLDEDPVRHNFHINEEHLLHMTRN